MPTDAPLPPGHRALILDQGLGDRAVWSDVIHSLEAGGMEVVLRRFYPHLTAADVTPPTSEDKPPYEVVLLAAGDAPGLPTSSMRLGEVDLARRYVEAGGLLVLAPRAGTLDSAAGASDWYLMNRILEELGAPVRIDRNVVLGDVLEEDPLPALGPTTWSYPSPAGGKVAYPYLQAPYFFPSGSTSRIAGGRVPTIRVDTDDASVLLTTYDHGFLEESLSESPTAKPLDSERTVGVILTVAAGHVAVVPRSVLTLGTTSEGVADKPAMDAESARSSHFYVQFFAGFLPALARGENVLERAVPVARQPLFVVGAPGLPASGSPAVEIGSPVVDLPVAAAPPAGDLSEPAPKMPSQPAALPSWLSSSAGRIVTAKDAPDPALATDGFAELQSHHIDALVSPTRPERLVDPLTSDEEKASLRTLHTQVAAIAAGPDAGPDAGADAGPDAGADAGPDAGADAGPDAAPERAPQWIVEASFAHSTFADNPTSYPWMIGAQGQQPPAPDPLGALLWGDVLLPTCTVVGELARDNPGLAGFALDLGLDADPPQHLDGYAFSEGDLETFLAAAPMGVDADALRKVPVAERLDVLVDQGLLHAYFAALEEEAAALGTRCREAARASAPNLYFLLRLPAHPTSWFHRGLLRGLGTPEQPVVVLTKEAWSNQAAEAWGTEGLSFVVLGGTSVGLWRAIDFGDVLYALAIGNRGYWFEAFEDLSATNPKPPPLHGNRRAYWSSVDETNKRL